MSGSLHLKANAQAGLHNWSPDGRRVAFYSDRTRRYELYTMNPDGSN